MKQLTMLAALPGRRHVSCSTVFSIVLLVLAVSAASEGAASEASVMLTGNHPAEAASLIPIAHAMPSAQLNMEATLALRNRAALDQLLADQQNPTSPRYHQWLTSQEFEARFGPSQQDANAVAQWLSSQGFQVTATSLESRYVKFTGKVADAERFFGTDIMLFGDGSSYSNVTDPVIPARFSGIISAIGGLDNFLHWTAGSSRPGILQANTAASRWPGDPMALLDSGPVTPAPQTPILSHRPDVTIGGITAFGPSDFRSFYDEDSLISGGITGATDCLAIVGDSDYTASAVTLFNSTFSLPASSIATVLVDGSNPGLNGDQIEALLDLEWSHAVAPGAPLRFYLGNGPASTYGPIVDAIQGAVNENLCGAISASFALCGAPSSFYTGVVSPIYAKGAAQGQSIFIISGDWGAAGLVYDASTKKCVVATSRTPNELGTDPNVTNVGGTSFAPIYDPSGNNVGDVPESAWNDGTNHGSTGGGASTVYIKPAYQKGTGVPADGRRDIPDVALIASELHPGVFIAAPTSGPTPVIECCFGGTSLSTPAWASISKLIAQLKHARLGLLNPILYALAQSGQAAAGLRDVTNGNNNYNGVTGYNATVGYDLTTGWGTADVATFAGAYTTGLSPSITSVPSPILVGGGFAINGSQFSPGALVNFFVATAGGPINAGPFTPISYSPARLMVDVPATVPLGQGFVEVQVVNADLNFEASNAVPALLQGSAAAGIPTLTEVNGVGLAATSIDPSYAVNNVETFIVQGTSVKLGGNGFDAADGVAVNVFCACTGGKVGPFIVNPGPGLTTTSFSFPLPAGVPTGPGSIVIINKGADGAYSKSSNAVSVPIGQLLTVTSVSQAGTKITVNGTGFSTLTVINLFNKQGASTVNLGGLGTGGIPKIPLTIVNSNQFTFTRPTAAVAGEAYVQAINPPFLPYTSSGSDPGGAFTLN